MFTSYFDLRVGSFKNFIRLTVSLNCVTVFIKLCNSIHNIFAQSGKITFEIENTLINLSCNLKKLLLFLLIMPKNAVKLFNKEYSPITRFWLSILVVPGGLAP